MDVVLSSAFSAGKTFLHSFLRLRLWPRVFGDLIGALARSAILPRAIASGVACQLDQPSPAGDSWQGAQPPIGESRVDHRRHPRRYETCW